MAPVAYSGALPPKKKSELQEIAAALRLSDQGTKDELQARIKKHLDAHQDDLEDDPTFAGLFGRRRRSVQPQSTVPAIPSTRFAPADPKPLSARRSVTALDPITEASATPAKDNDMRDVSIFLKHPFSPADTTPAQSPRQLDPTTPSSLPPLPPSPAKSIIEHFPKAAEVKAAVTQQLYQQQILHNGNELLIALRAFLSNSQNIWSLTSFGELLYILAATIPWKTLTIPLTSTARVSLLYPPISVFQASAFWAVLLHWALPTLVLPTLLGCLISFNPALAPARTPTPGAPAAPAPAPPAPLDPLTAAIVRLAGATAYPYAAAGRAAGVVHLDVLGAQWRVLGASVGLAFAFAEAISGAPQAAVRTLEHEHRQQLLLSAREGTPARRALMASEEPEAAEVD